mmetsp:Transcript_89612/g.232323  ORF Transcript_89612/g.232323 Transcript_89612/m.232323 type:complete len:296 (+) Transcript_89612:1-888(+)
MSAGGSRCFALMAADPRSPGDVEVGTLGPQPLELVPGDLASPQERQLASALGIAEHRLVPRLPGGLENCHRGSKCFWSWLARAALEQVAGVSLGHLELPEMIDRLRSELAELRRQARKDASALATLRDVCGAGEAELRELRAARARLQKLETENEELRGANAGLTKTVDVLREDFKEATGRCRAIEAELAEAAERADEAESALEAMESKLDMACLLRERDAEARVEDQKLLHLARAESTRVQQEALSVAILMSTHRKKRRPAKRSSKASPPRGFQIPRGVPSHSARRGRSAGAGL